jgi:ferredoxin
MNVTVDAGKCSGHGQCYVLASAVFTSDAEGFNAARGTTIEVPHGLEEDARRAAVGCPESAISIAE